MAIKEEEKIKFFFILFIFQVNKMYHGVLGYDDHPMVELPMEKGRLIMFSNF